MKKKIKITLVVVVLALLTGAALANVEGELGILTAGTLSGENPATGEPWKIGDTYRFAFYTSGTITAESADIETYNVFVQGLADATTVYDIGTDEGVTWKIIGSTSAVDARTNTSTDPSDANDLGGPIYLLDGATLVASDNADLWDGEIQHVINLTELGTAPDYLWPATGTYWDGTVCTGKPGTYGSPIGGGSQICQGYAGATTEWVWRTNTSGDSTKARPVYALSDPLVITGDPTDPVVDAGVDMLTWSGEPVLLAPTVVNNSDPVTALTFAWSAYPATGVVFTPSATVETPNVIITKATDNPSVVTLTLAVNNVGSGKPDRTDTMAIDVYDDACKAANADGTLVYDSTDYDQDCDTDFADFAVLAAAWLVDYTITAPIAK